MIRWYNDETLQKCTPVNPDGINQLAVEKLKTSCMYICSRTDFRDQNNNNASDPPPPSPFLYNSHCLSFHNINKHLLYCCSAFE